jgi:hypothetical protein
MLKVNFGCGEQYAEGWVNVDHAGMPHRKDLELDVTGPLPWYEEIDYAYVGHLLEHLYVNDVIVFLQRLRAAMKPHSLVMVVGPDCLRAEGMELAGQTLEVPLEQIRHGAGRWSGDVHRWECTAWAVRRLLIVTGWESVTDVGIDNVTEMWPVAFRGPKWQCAVAAHAGRGPFHDFDS